MANENKEENKKTFKNVQLNDIVYKREKEEEKNFEKPLKVANYKRKKLFFRLKAAPSYQ